MGCRFGFGVKNYILCICLLVNSQKWSIFVKMGRLIFSSFFQRIFFEVGVDMGVFEVAEAESDFRFWRRLSPSEIWPKKNEKWSEMDQKWDVE